MALGYEEDDKPLNIHYNRPYREQLSQLKTVQKYQKPLEVFEALKIRGYNPADIGPNMVTMRESGFKKLLADYGGKCLVYETKSSRISAVYIGFVEISFVEFKGDEGWELCENWRPLSE